MSSILKALKRLEEDRAERMEAPVDIARDILRQPRKRRRSASGLVPALAGGGAVVVVGTLLLLYGWQSVGAPEIAAMAEPAAARPAAASESEVIEVRMAPPPAANVNKPAASSASPAGRSAELPVLPSAPAAPPAAPPASSVALQAAALPHLAVSGIAYQPERQARLAVVNDLPVMEGTVIEGARVEEILEDRVRFSREGSTFEVALGEKE